jgi:GH24 family phage-related lysozyme (muramidase)
VGLEALSAPLVNLPPPPELSPAGHSLILEAEGFDARPAWPLGSSGVTVGWGYDLGYSRADVIKSDWHELPQRDRLAAVSGLTGRKAQAKIPELRDILIARDIGTRVFDLVDVAREYANCRRAYGKEEFDALRPNAQAALISLGFNRGYSMSGPNRVEMRNIRDAVPKRDYEYMAGQLRAMVHVWRGTSIERGMRNRRYAEAKLMETS